VTGQFNEKFSAIREPFLDDVYGDIKGTKMTPVGIRARVLSALNSLLDMSAAYQAGLLVVTYMSSDSSASKADGKTASAYRYKYETILADQHRMLQDNEAGLDFSYDLNNLASLAVLTLFLEEGLQRNLKISLDSRLSCKFLKRLTGGAGLNTEVGEVQKKAAGTTRKEIRNELTVGVARILSLGVDHILSPPQNGEFLLPDVDVSMRIARVICVSNLSCIPT